MADKHFKISLDKLHRVLERLEGQTGRGRRVHPLLMESDSGSHLISQDPGLHLADSHATYVAVKAAEALRHEHKRGLLLRKRLAAMDLRGLLFAQNVLSGVHEKLTIISKLQSFIAYGEPVAKATPCTWLTREQFEAVRARQEKGEGATWQFEGVPLTSPEIAQQVVKDFRAQLDSERDKVSALNHQWMVEFDLDEEVAADLGLA